MNTWGKNIRLSIFGESHGEGIGIVIDGLCAGLAIDMEEIALDMARRAPGKDGLTTARAESDQPQILSGVYGQKTTGAPLAALIRNTDTRSGDYAAHAQLARPSHADFAAFAKHGGHNDPRGGGHFSGRLTAPLVFAGAVARQALKREGVSVGAHVLRVGVAQDERFDACKLQAQTLDTLRRAPFPTLSESAAEKMREQILSAKQEGDSVGGEVEAAAIGLHAGVGEPFFYSLESAIASLLFSIPGVKGVEFGAGFELARMRGSNANDEFYLKDGAVRTRANHAGGINGGLSNGMPLIVRAAMRPTPSIAKAQATVDVAGQSEGTIEIVGRHDPCIAVRALVAVESALMLALLDSIMGERGR